MPFALVSPDLSLVFQVLALDLGSSQLGSSNFGNTTVVNP